MQAVVGSGKQASLLPIRLIALPLPPDKAEISRSKLKRRASRRQEALDPRSLLAAGFMVLVTSLPAAIPAGEICAAYRLRWQVELAFKRLKSLLHIDRLPTRTDGRQPELAVCPPDPGSADRRHLPGVPGIFPLSRLLRVAAARAGGRPNWRSMLCLAASPASRCPPSCWPIRAPTNFSPTPNDGGNDKCFLPFQAYPDAYGARPGHKTWMADLRRP